MLARQPVGTDAIGTEIERAVLLGALDRRQDAQQAFIDILRRAPTHFSALNEFGTLLTNMGAIDAACRVYSEAILHHPDNPMARVNLANLLLRANKHVEAREHYETVLRIDPDHAEAHQGLGAVLSDIGDRAGARHHFQKGFRGHAISSLPYRGTRPPVTVLQLVSSGGGNIPTAALLDDCVFLTSVVVADYLDPSAVLPPHQLIFNAIGDADLCAPALQAAARLTARTDVPVINDPRAVMKTGRIDNARRLGAVPGVIAPRTTAIARDILAGPDGVAALANHQFAFPLLLRSPGYHTGRNFIIVEQAAELSAAAAGLPGDDLLGHRISRCPRRGRQCAKIPRDDDRRPNLSAASGDIAEMEGALFHLRYGRQAGPSARRKRAFLPTCRQRSATTAMAALEEIQDVLGLDYGGIDFGLGPDGDLLLFEANATMVIAPVDPDERWAYRRTAISTIIDAVVAMLKHKSTQAGRA